MTSRAPIPRPPGARQQWRRAGDLLRGLGAALALLLVVAGVPLLLAGTIGWPLPHGLPSPGDLRDSLSFGNGIPDDAIIKGIAVLAWLYWAHFMWCALVEARALARGRAARPVLFGGVNQAIASRLVGAVLLLLPANGTLAHAASAAELRPSPAVVQVAANPQPQQLNASQELQPLLAPAPRAHDGKTYHVQRGDTLWDIAARHLPLKDARDAHLAQDEGTPGDPLRWREIFHLNKGRVQPDGATLNDPHWIRPGWQLLLPHDAIGIPRQHQAAAGADRTTAPAGGSHGTPIPPPENDSPDTPSATNTTYPSTSGTSTSTTEAPGSSASTGPSSTIPRGVPVPGGVTGSGRAAPSPPTQTAPTTTEPSGQEQETATGNTDTPSHSGPDVSVPAEVFGAGLLAFGLLVVVARRRRAQLRGRRTGEPTPILEPAAAQQERVLRSVEAPEAVELLDRAMRTLTTALAREGSDPPPVLGVLLGHDEVQLLLGQWTSRAPAPFELAPSGRAWRLPAAAGFEAEPTQAPLPALVTIGTVGSSWLLVNLENVGILSLTGDRAAARSLLAAMALELSTNPWVDCVEVILVGFNAAPSGLERLRTAGRLDEILPVLEAQRAEVGRVLGETGASSLLAGRLRGDIPDSWVPTVLLCAEPPDAASLRALTIEPGRSPVGAVVVGSLEGSHWTLELPSHPGAAMRIPELGLDVVPVQLHGDQYEAIVSLLDSFVPRRVAGAAGRQRTGLSADENLGQGTVMTAAEAEGPEPPNVEAEGPEPPNVEAEAAEQGEGLDPDPDGPEPPPASEAGAEEAGEPGEAVEAANAAEPEHAEEAAADTAVDGAANEDNEAGRPPPHGEIAAVPGTRGRFRASDGEIEVRVLGRVEIAGLERVERGKSEELIVLLALHPYGIDGYQLAEALWPGHPPAKATINTTTTVARAYLGTSEDGSLLLPHARNGIYRLHPTITSDWGRFQQLVAHDALSSALELVRGHPFEGVKARTYGWALTDLAPVMESMIVDVADRLAERCLTNGDHSGAQHAARRGLAISPYDERLYRRLMLAADVAGNPAGVEAVMQELLTRLDDGGLEAYDELHDETRELYERLRRSRPPRKARPPGRSAG